MSGWVLAEYEFPAAGPTAGGGGGRCLAQWSRLVSSTADSRGVTAHRNTVGY